VSETSAIFWRTSPAPRLAPLVASISYSRDDASDFVPTPYCVLPDGRMDLLLTRDARGGAVVAEVLGTKTRALVVEDATPCEKMLVSFRAGVVPWLLGVSARELRDRGIALGEIDVSWARALAARVAETPALRLRDAVEPVLAAAAARAEERRGDQARWRALAAAVREIAAGLGPVRVADVARRIGFGERRLERLFDELVGVGPKAFARIVRFRGAVRRLGAGARLAEAAAASGYSDQAHMTREFRALCGRTPAELALGAARDHEEAAFRLAAPVAHAAMAG
jgi:AraC-like DNA-binding protein